MSYQDHNIWIASTTTAVYSTMQAYLSTDHGRQRVRILHER